LNNNNGDEEIIRRNREHIKNIITMLEEYYSLTDRILQTLSSKRILDISVISYNPDINNNTLYILNTLHLDMIRTKASLKQAIPLLRNYIAESE